jgi:hypothetical protein
VPHGKTWGREVYGAVDQEFSVNKSTIYINKVGYFFCVEGGIL